MAGISPLSSKSLSVIKFTPINYLKPPIESLFNLKYDPLPCRYQLASVSLGSKIAFQGSSFSFLIHLLLILRSSSRESGTLFQRGVEAIDGVGYKGVDPWNQRHWPKMTEEKISWEVPLFL
jgi:hypothetical protein